jgi:hypothetical protein
MGPAAPPQKRGPKPRWSDAELLEKIRAVLAASPFLGEGHRKVWARLRWQGVRTSKARVLRLLREAQLLATRTGQPRTTGRSPRTSPTRCGGWMPPAV